MKKGGLFVKNCTNIRVRYKETDQMGVVYYGNYFTWFEVGRNEFFRDMGYTCEYLETQGIFLPVIETGCKYIYSAKFDDEIIIETKIEKMEGVRLRLKYNIIRKRDNLLLAEGFTEHAFVNKEMKPVNFRKKFKEIWDILKKAENEEKC